MASTWKINEWVAPNVAEIHYYQANEAATLVVGDKAIELEPDEIAHLWVTGPYLLKSTGMVTRISGAQFVQAQNERADDE